MSRAPRSYWRSLGQLAADPQSQSFLGREFPEGASELPEGVSRREMLGLVGASLALASLAGCRRPVERIVPYVTAPEEILPGVPLHYATTMPFGRTAYGLVVESHEGRPTKVEGNSYHTNSFGASSAWMQAAILDLYDPDRSQTPLDHGQAKKWAEFVAAWKALEPAYVASGGAGLAVLSESFASPTLERLAERLRERFPRVLWVAWEPLSDENVQLGFEQLVGQPLEVVNHLEQAQLVLAIDADFLLTEPDGVRHARAFADLRRIAGPPGSMSRMYAVESALSLTGAQADHRLRLRPGAIPAFVGHLAAELGAQRLAPLRDLALPAFPPLEGVDPAWLKALAADLMFHRGRGVIVAGQAQPPAVQAAVFALNTFLLNVGTTVTVHDSGRAGRSRLAGLAELAAAARDGAVSGLVVLGGNPVYNAPADLDFAGALAAVEHSIHLGSHVDETGARAAWHLPRAHFLESWGDARSAAGTLSVIQPLIAPLYDGRSAAELLALVATGEERAGYDLVGETWRAALGEDDFDQHWQELLFTGVLTTGALNDTKVPLEPLAPARVERTLAELAAAASAWAPRPGTLELLFQPSPAVFDGRFANNGWLQELPDPITKITWDNAALVSPATASDLGLEAEQLVRVGHAGRELELPAWIVPGQADGVVVLHLGWGRTAAGRIGNGRGFNAYGLRTSAAPGFASGATLARASGRYHLAETQHHAELDPLGEEEQVRRAARLVRETTLEEFGRQPGFVRELEVEHPPLQSMWREHSYDEGYQWGMTIDLNACIGCNACVVACQSENNIPIVGKEQVARGREMHWIRIDRYFSGTPQEPETVFQPVPCMHCENAPCEQVCPVAATVHDREGLNTMVYNRCIGTRYCSNNCPYKVRRFNFFNFTKDTPEVQRLAANPDVTVRSRGVMEKCTYCVQRINRAKSEAKAAGRAVRDGDIRTACEQACPARAITFGNIRDADSVVARMKQQERNYVLLAELNDKPRTSYLAKLRNPHPELEEA